MIKTNEIKVLINVSLDEEIVKKINSCQWSTPRSKIINDILNLYIDDFLEGISGESICDIVQGKHRIDIGPEDYTMYIQNLQQKKNINEKVEKTRQYLQKKRMSKNLHKEIGKLNRS